MGREGKVFESHEHELLNNLNVLQEDSDWNMFLALEGPLGELISCARSSDGRAKLAELRTVPLLLSLLENLHKTLSQDSSSRKVYDILLLLLKLIRNLCAGDSTNQDAFLEVGGVGIVARITTTLFSIHSHHSDGLGDNSSNGLLEEGSVLERVKASFGSISFSSPVIPPPVSCLEMMLQLLGNFSQRGETTQNAVWEVFFPNLLLELTTLHRKEICGPLSMLLYTCCRRNGKRCWQLCKGDGAALVAILMVSTVDNDSDSAPVHDSPSKEQVDWLELLVQQICLQEPLFPLLFTNLGVPPLSREVEHVQVDTDELLTVCKLWIGTSSLTSLQASLLYILCDCLASEDGNSVQGTGDMNLPMPLRSMCFMVDVLRHAAVCAAKNVSVSSVPTLFSASPGVQVLGFVLSLLRLSFASDSATGDREKLDTVLLSHGLIDLLLDLLRALGPPEASGKGETGGVLLEDRPPLEEGAFPSKNPYQGYRRDIVAVIANGSHCNYLVQEQVRKKGSLLLVLQQCMVEKENPFLREWGLWAMRNLLEGNERNQEEIGDLEVKESINLPELRQMGLNVEIGPNTRRPRLVNDRSPSC